MTAESRAAALLGAGAATALYLGVVAGLAAAGVVSRNDGVATWAHPGALLAGAVLLTAWGAARLPRAGHARHLARALALVTGGVTASLLTVVDQHVVGAVRMDPSAAGLAWDALLHSSGVLIAFVGWERKEALS